MRREHHGAVVGRRRPDDLFQHLAPVLVEAGVGFVEQQQSRFARERVGERQAPALTLRQSAVRDLGHPLQAHPLERSVGLGDIVARRAGDEAHILLNGEVVVAEGLVADERDGPAHAPRFDRQIHAQHFSLPCAQRQQPRAQPQERGLARTVRTAEQHDLARVDLEVGTGERGKSSEHADGRPKAYAAQPELRGPGVRYGAELTEMPVKPANRAVEEPVGAVEAPRRAGTIDAVRRAIAGVGRTLVTVGLLVLLFVVYQLWGTGLFTARAQSDLKSKFQAQVARSENDTVAPVPTTATTVKAPTVTVRPTTTTVHYDNVRPAPPTPAEGEVEGIISIPKIGADFAYVEGTSRDDLKKGPGHYPGTPLPGTLGNAAIVGHRTTYLHPFQDVDKLVPGDDIIIHDTVGGVFDYQMTKQLIVAPTDVWVVDNTPDAQLTLTACNPKGSASQRIVIKAKLVPSKSTKPTKPKPKPKPVTLSAGPGKAPATEAAGLAQGLSGQTRSLVPSVVWGIFAAVVGLAWWWGFRRWRHPLTWVVGVLPFLVALFPFYVYLERAAPRRLLIRVGLSLGERGSGGDADRTVRAPHAGAALAFARRMDRRRGLRQERAPPAHRRVQVPGRDERGAVALRRRCRSWRRRALLRQSRRRARARARARGIRAFVVMPKNASAAKRAAVERYGGEITCCDNTIDARRAALVGVLERTGAVEVHPFDDERVIAGAGTAALELIDEVPDLDVVVTPVGGGGMCSGTSIAVAPTRVIGGVPRDRTATIADGLRTGCSPRTEAILDAHDVERIIVDDPDVVEAMRVVWSRTKQLIEPSAALAFAAARAARLGGARVGIICSGGNLDLDALPW